MHSLHIISNNLRFFFWRVQYLTPIRIRVDNQLAFFLLIWLFSRNPKVSLSYQQIRYIFSLLPPKYLITLCQLRYLRALCLLYLLQNTLLHSIRNSPGNFRYKTGRFLCQLTGRFLPGQFSGRLFLIWGDVLLTFFALTFFGGLDEKGCCYCFCGTVLDNIGRSEGGIVL